MKRSGKWFIAIVIMAIIAVVLTIVFINLFREKDTKQLAESVNNATEIGYLAEDNAQYTAIVEYLEKVETVLTTSAEKSEVENFKDTYTAYVVIGDFFNRQIVFSQFNETYKNLRKGIEGDLKKGQETAEQLQTSINDTKQLVEGSDYWTANTWENNKGMMKDLLSFTSNAFNRLGDVYQASVPSKLMNNGLTDVVFDTIETLSAKMFEKVREDNTCGQTIYNFANYYLTINGEKTILNYNYSTIMQTKVADIKEKGAESTYYNDLLTGRIAG